MSRRDFLLFSEFYRQSVVSAGGKNYNFLIKIPNGRRDMYEIDKEKFGAFVAQLRKGQGITQKELAQKVNVSDKAVSKWERGVSHS